MKIALAQDHHERIEGYTSLMKVYGYHLFPVDNLDQLMRTIKEEEIDILIQDVNFGNLDARTIIPIIKKRFPQLRIILEVNVEDIEVAKTAVDLNVNACVYHSEPPSVMLHALETIIEGNSYISPEIKDLLGL
jgi:DNA-binding NarL/FixJ family response regulator